MIEHDRVSAFLHEKLPHRFLALSVFVGLILLFRHLLPLLVFFVAFERAIGAASVFISSRTALGRKASVLVVIAAVAAALGVSAFLGIGSLVREVQMMRHTFPERISAVRDNPLYLRIREQLGDTDHVVEGAKHYAGSALGYASAIGHIVVYATIGLILAVVFLLEHDHLKEFHRKIDARSLHGTIIRWLGHLADAVVVTVQLQFIVAACNTVMTLPVLLLLGIHHVAPLMVLIFVSGLVPVIGNIVSGTVLSLLAFQAKGWFGVGIFTALTVILHKIESYYLNPRLTARHVHLPGFILILSLIAWEHLLGFIGLFASFPVLFIAGRIRAEFKQDDGELDEPRSSAFEEIELSPERATAPTVDVADVAKEAGNEDSVAEA